MSNFYHFLKRNVILFALLFTQIVSNCFAGTPGKAIKDKAISPVVNYFTPQSAKVGGYVLIYGKYFTGATAVTFGGTNAAIFFVNTDSTITAWVGSGSTGDISVITPYGTASRPGF